jgi:hypothetical protein
MLPPLTGWLSACGARRLYRWGLRRIELQQPPSLKKLQNVVKAMGGDATAGLASMLSTVRGFNNELAVAITGDE